MTPNCAKGFSISPLARDLPPSGIREFFDLVIGMEDVISLGVGEPDFATPWKICDAVVDSFRRGMTSYTSNHGLLQLREAIAEDLLKRYGVSYDPATEIVITMGVSEGMDGAMRALLAPGDEVIVPSRVTCPTCPASPWRGQPGGLRTVIENDFRHSLRTSRPPSAPARGDDHR